MKFFKILSLLLLLSGTLTFAGTKGKLVGKVTDQNTDEPLIGVNILIDGTYLGGTTDADGKYLILNVPPGTYKVIYRYIGYQTVEVSDVRMNVDFTTNQDVQMAEETLELGQTVVVSAGRELIRKDLTSSQAIITSEDIEAMPVEEFEDVLQMQAGVTRGDGGFHIRGGRSSEVTFRVDGI
ncbi:MAG: carboxypeptidase-like regulatory domain-containing protein, partial [Melioribacteraceae bacterium]|nr:carboxypeptidase-like regulatory domain-containing protein [Melioribacteraceae bacterium]